MLGQMGSVCWHAILQDAVNAFLATRLGLDMRLHHNASYINAYRPSTLNRQHPDVVHCGYTQQSCATQGLGRTVSMKKDIMHLRLTGEQHPGDKKMQKQSSRPCQCLQQVWCALRHNL